MSYNGWTNYATWRVNLEIFDGVGLRDLGFYGTTNVSELKDAVKTYAEEIIDNAPDGLTKDYAFAFLSDVNWWEIAQHILGESIDDEEEESEED